MSPSASTMANVWTASEVTNVCVCPATWANAARETSTSACQTPVTPEGPTTAFSSPTATDVNAAPVTQVPMSTWQHPTDCSIKLKMYRSRHTLWFCSPGQRCDKVFDGCKGRPCRNGGTCAVASNTPHGFICKCPPVSKAVSLISS